MTSKVTGEGDAAAVKKSIDIFIYNEWHLSLDMKTKVVQHIKREWMRECESARVWECESVRVWECEIVRVWDSESVIWFPAFVWHSDIFLDITTRSCEFANHRAGIQLKTYDFYKMSSSFVG